MKRPPPFFHWRCRACWLLAGIVALTVASFASLDLQLAKLFSVEAMARMGRFAGELLVPATDASFLGQRRLAVEQKHSTHGHHQTR